MNLGPVIFGGVDVNLVVPSLFSLLHEIRFNPINMVPGVFETYKGRFTILIHYSTLIATSNCLG